MACPFPRLEYYRKLMGLDDETSLWRRTTVNTREELTLAIRTTWEAIPINLLVNLFNSLPHRMLVVIEKRGGHTRY